MTSIVKRIDIGQEWILLNSGEDLLVHYPKHVWGTYRPQPWSSPEKYPCVFKEIAVMNNSNGSDHAMLAYLYDFELIDGEQEFEEGSTDHTGKLWPEWDGYDSDFAQLNRTEYEFARALVNAKVGESIEPNGLGCEDCGFTGIHGIDRLERHDTCNRFDGDQEARAFVLRAVRSQMYAEGNRPERTVVCAANRYGSVIVPGARHHDTVMNSLLQPLLSSGQIKDEDRGEQGFIDQRGNFLTREEAYAIAVSNGQRRFRCGGDNSRLFSENLY